MAFLLCVPVSGFPLFVRTRSYWVRAPLTSLELDHLCEAQISEFGHTLGPAQGARSSYFWETQLNHDVCQNHTKRETAVIRQPPVYPLSVLMPTCSLPSGWFTDPFSLPSSLAAFLRALMMAHSCAAMGKGWCGSSRPWAVSLTLGLGTLGGVRWREVTRCGLMDCRSSDYINGLDPSPLPL